MRILITILRLLLIPSYSDNKKDKVVYEYQRTDLFNLTNEVLNINGKIIYSYDFNKNRFIEKSEDYFHNSDIFSIYFKKILIHHYHLYAG